MTLQRKLKYQTVLFGVRHCNYIHPPPLQNSTDIGIKHERK